MSETYVTYRVWGGCKAPLNLEYDGRLIGEIARELTVDRDALLALAEDVDGTADDSGGLEPLAGVFRDIARCIREACGEVER